MRITILEIAVGAIVMGVLIMLVSILTACAEYKTSSDYPQGATSEWRLWSPAPVPAEQKKASPAPFKTRSELN